MKVLSFAYKRCSEAQGTGMESGNVSVSNFKPLDAQRAGGMPLRCILAHPMSELDGHVIAPIMQTDSDRALTSQFCSSWTRSLIIKLDSTRTARLLARLDPSLPPAPSLSLLSLLRPPLPSQSLLALPAPLALPLALTLLSPSPLSLGELLANYGPLPHICWQIGCTTTTIQPR